MAIIDTLFMTKTAENHTLWGRTYLYSPYKGVPPPPPRACLFTFYMHFGHCLEMIKNKSGDRSCLHPLWDDKKLCIFFSKSGSDPDNWGDRNCVDLTEVYPDDRGFHMPAFIIFLSIPSGGIHNYSFYSAEIQKL